MRKNVKVKSVSRSELCESISLEIQLPSGHHMLMCGIYHIYHPPRSNYQEDDLIEYVTDIVDQFLERHPSGLVLCGGDLNRLDFEKLSNLSGLKALIDFPARGDSVLDNCLTNNEALFSRCYPIVAQMKTDHNGVILPAGVRLKPLKFSSTMRDYREHRKIMFYHKLLEQDWDHVNDNSDLDTAVNSLHSTLEKLMNECFPSKSIRMSSRDPPWMSPLVKSLLKKKTRSRKGGGRGLTELTEKIGRP